MDQFNRAAAARPRAGSTAAHQIEIIINSINWLTFSPKDRYQAFTDKIEGAKIRKSNIILRHTTPRGPNSVPTET
jgi:hypothetical protein